MPRYDAHRVTCRKQALEAKSRLRRSDFAVPAAEHADSLPVKLVLSLLQLCKLAVHQPGGADILGRDSQTRRRC